MCEIYISFVYNQDYESITSFWCFCLRFSQWHGLVIVIYYENDDNDFFAAQSSNIPMRGVTELSIYHIPSSAVYFFYSLIHFNVIRTIDSI